MFRLLQVADVNQSVKQRRVALVRDGVAVDANLAGTDPNDSAVIPELLSDGHHVIIAGGLSGLDGVNGLLRGLH